ncbi:MAG: PepSY-associated TM helix domain-containing protein [Verrucomicrobiota bacterium]
MVSFATLIFFSFTGITLNHPTWFGAGEEKIKDLEGEFAAAEVGPKLDKLTIAESLRSRHSLRGAVSEFEVDEFECMVVFKGPGYAADVFIDRDSGAYSVTETTTGMMAIMNDLHKGRDTGTAWSWVIDLSAILMLLMGLSGFGLLFYVRKRRVSGVVAAFVGTALLLFVWIVFVP